MSRRVKATDDRMSAFSEPAHSLRHAVTLMRQIIADDLSQFPSEAAQSMIAAYEMAAEAAELLTDPAPAPAETPWTGTAHELEEPHVRGRHTLDALSSFAVKLQTANAIFQEAACRDITELPEDVADALLERSYLIAETSAQLAAAACLYDVRRHRALAKDRDFANTQRDLKSTVGRPQRKARRMVAPLEETIKDACLDRADRRKLQ